MLNPDEQDVSEGITFSPLALHIEEEAIPHECIPASWRDDIRRIVSLLLADDRSKWIVYDDNISGRSYLMNQIVSSIPHYSQRLNLPYGNLCFVEIQDKFVSHLLSSPSWITAIAQRMEVPQKALVFVFNSMEAGFAFAGTYPNARIVVNTYADPMEELNDDGINYNSIAAWNYVSSKDLPISKAEYFQCAHAALDKEVSSVFDIPNIVKYACESLWELIVKEYDDLVAVSSKDQNGVLLSLPLGVFIDLIRTTCGFAYTGLRDDKFKRKFIRSAVRDDAITGVLESYVSSDEDAVPGNHIHVVTSGGQTIEYTISDKEKERLGLSQQKAEPVSLRKISDVEKDLKRVIFGQDRALDKIIKGLTIPALGLNDDNKPLRSMLLLGKTGTGKTETTIQISKHLADREMNLVRIDMSEFAEAHESAKLFGSPPGYVAHDDGGMLTNAVKNHPYSVILLDEVEKAHPRIWDTFLQVLDAGRLTDGSGDTVDFTNCVVVMTSNIGANEVSKVRVGFGDSSYAQRQQDNERLIHKALSEVFRPEMINRIDDIVVFDEIDRATAERVVYERVDAFNQKLSQQHKLRVHISPAIVSRILENAQYTKYGARDVVRLTQGIITESLVNTFGDNVNKERKRLTHVYFDIVDGMIVKA